MDLRTVAEVVATVGLVLSLGALLGIIGHWVCPD